MCGGYFEHHCGDSLTEICCFHTRAEGGQDKNTKERKQVSSEGSQFNESVFVCS